MEQTFFDPLVSYFLSLPDEILLTEIFPRFSIDIIIKLCSIHTRFNNICQNNTLWQIKTTDEFPTFVSQKPSDVSWRDYYKLLVNGKLLPVYYHGDRIGYIPFDSNNINILITSSLNLASLTIPQINQLTVVNIVLLNNQREPIIVIKYPSLKINIKDNNYDNIEKILLIINDEFGISGSEKEEKLNKEIIYQELTSLLGHPPIYGIFSNIVTSQNGIFAIIDNRNISDLKPVRKWNKCSILSHMKLLNILNDLNSTKEDLSEYSKEQLCDTIKQTLEKIGHIIR